MAGIFRLPPGSSIMQYGSYSIVAILGHCGVVPKKRAKKRQGLESDDEGNFGKLFPTIATQSRDAGLQDSRLCACWLQLES